MFDIKSSLSDFFQVFISPMKYFGMIPKADYLNKWLSDFYFVIWFIDIQNICYNAKIIL